MPVTVSTETLAALVIRLRSAGCVFAEDEATMLVQAADSPESLDQLTRRRTGGEPLEQVLGWAEFCGLRISLRPGVFVPRRRTELLVREAVARVGAGSIVLDLCCGSGAIGLAIWSAIPRVELHAAELDPIAAACAQDNLGATIPVYVGDLFQPLPERLRGQVDLITANVPYVPSGDVALMPSEARLHEPLVALDGGDDGLTVLRRVAGDAPGWLRPGGALLIEVSDRQVGSAVEAFTVAGLTASVIEDVALGATVVGGVVRES